MKITLTVLAFLIAYYASNWLFNHVNAWIGIGLAFATTLVAVKLIIREIKKEDEKN